MRGVSVHASAAVRGRDGRGRSSGRLHARWRARAVEAGRCASVQARTRTRSSSGGVAWRGPADRCFGAWRWRGVGWGWQSRFGFRWGAGGRAESGEAMRQVPGEVGPRRRQVELAAHGSRRLRGKERREELASRARLRCGLAGAAMLASLCSLGHTDGRCWPGLCQQICTKSSV